YGITLYFNSFPTRRSSDLVLVIAMTVAMSTALVRGTQEQGESFGDKLKNFFVRPKPTPKHRKKKKASPTPTISPSPAVASTPARSEEHTSELQSPDHLVCR